MGSKLVEFLASIDKKLEDANIISELKQTDDNAINEFQEVIFKYKLYILCI